MNGVHDLGGMMGFGPIQREADEPVFHAEWTASFALTHMSQCDSGGNSRASWNCLKHARKLSSGCFFGSSVVRNARDPIWPPMSNWTGLSGRAYVCESWVPKKPENSGSSGY